MGSIFDIVVVGSHAPGLFIRVKRIPKAGETVFGWDFHEPKDGGKGTNQAIASALLGAKTSFVGCFGRDRIGDAGETYLKEAGVDITWLIRDETEATGVGFILLDENGIPAMVSSIGANFKLTAKHVNDALHAMSDSKVMLTQFEIPTDVALHAAETARSLGMISIINPGPAPETPIKDLSMASILIPNEIEAQILLGREPDTVFEEEDLVKELKHTSKAEVVLITLGGNGVIGIDKNGLWRFKAMAVDVIDTSGAGDIFCASLAVAIKNGKSIREASAWACKVASLSVSKQGTIPSYPTLEEVNSSIK
jgi:ribokinase